MQALEVFQVSVKKRVFVIPLNFTPYCSDAFDSLNVINFMRSRFTRNAVNSFLYFEVVLGPSKAGKRLSKPLRKFGFAPT